MVEGLNVEYEIMGKSKDYPGMCYVKEKPYTVTEDIKLVDPTDEKATDVEWRFTEEGDRVSDRRFIYV